MTKTSSNPRYSWEAGFLLSTTIVPKTTPEYQTDLDAGNLDAIETLIMERIDAAPHDITFCMPAYRGFIKREENARAEALLQLHIDALKAHDDVTVLSLLLCNILAAWPECPIAHKRVLEHLRKMYIDSPGYDKFLTYYTGSKQAGLDALRQLELWLRYDEGCILFVASRGVARVKEANPKLGLIRIVFESGEVMTLRIDEAQRMALSLPVDHFLYQKFKNPQLLITQAESDPAGLLDALFSSIKKPLQLAELRSMLSGIVAEKQWAGWWNKASKNPHITIAAGTKPLITWNSSASGADAAIITQFDVALPYEQLDMFQRHEKRSPSIALHMKRGLARCAQAVRTAQPSLALEIALLLEKDTEPKDALGEDIATGIIDKPNAAAIISEIKDRLTRRKAVVLAKRIRPDWPDLYVRLLHLEPDTQILTLLYDAVREKSGEDEFESLIRTTLDEPARSPRFYLWLCKEIIRRPELSTFANWNFLVPLLGVLDHGAFKGHHPALRKLFDLGEAADRAIATLDEQTGRRLLDALSKDRTLEEYRTDRIKKELYRLFPSLHENKPQTLYVTQEALEKKRVEFEKLVKEDIPHNTREIQRTREYGDLRENFEYHAARHRQEMLSSQAKTLHDQLTCARIIDPATVNTSKISIGTRVTLRGTSPTTAPHTITILGPWDSDPAKNILSYTSAAGELLLNAPLGGTVQFDGNDYIVDKIDLWCAANE